MLTLSVKREVTLQMPLWHMSEISKKHFYHYCVFSAYQDYLPRFWNVVQGFISGFAAVNLVPTKFCFASHHATFSGREEMSKGHQLESPQAIIYLTLSETPCFWGFTSVHQAIAWLPSLIVLSFYFPEKQYNKRFRKFNLLKFTALWPSDQSLNSDSLMKFSHYFLAALQRFWFSSNENSFQDAQVSKWYPRTDLSAVMWTRHVIV